MVQTVFLLNYYIPWVLICLPCMQPCSAGQWSLTQFPTGNVPERASSPFSWWTRSRTWCLVIGFTWFKSLRRQTYHLRIQKRRENMWQKGGYLLCSSWEFGINWVDFGLICFISATSAFSFLSLFGSLDLFNSGETKGETKSLTLKFNVPICFVLNFNGTIKTLINYEHKNFILSEYKINE